MVEHNALIGGEEAGIWYQGHVLTHALLIGQCFLDFMVKTHRFSSLYDRVGEHITRVDINLPKSAGLRLPNVSGIAIKTGRHGSGKGNIDGFRYTLADLSVNQFSERNAVEIYAEQQPQRVKRLLEATEKLPGRTSIYKNLAASRKICNKEELINLFTNLYPSVSIF